MVMDGDGWWWWWMVMEGDGWWWWWMVTDDDGDEWWRMMMVIMVTDDDDGDGWWRMTTDKGWWRMTTDDVYIWSTDDGEWRMVTDDDGCWRMTTDDDVYDEQVHLIILMVQHRRSYGRIWNARRYTYVLGHAVCAVKLRSSPIEILTAISLLGQSGASVSPITSVGRGRALAGVYSHSRSVPDRGVVTRTLDRLTPRSGTEWLCLQHQSAGPDAYIRMHRGRQIEGATVVYSLPPSKDRLVLPDWLADRPIKIQTLRTCFLEGGLHASISFRSTADQKGAQWPSVFQSD